LVGWFVGWFDKLLGLKLVCPSHVRAFQFFPSPGSTSVSLS
jgi:hypothetical protein